MWTMGDQASTATDIILELQRDKIGFGHNLKDAWVIFLCTLSTFDIQGKSTRRWLLCLVNPRERIDMVRAMIFLDIRYIEEDKLLHRARVKLRQFQKNKSVWFWKTEWRRMKMVNGASRSVNLSTDQCPNL